MTLRILALLTLTLGTLTLLAYLHLIGKGPLANPAARHLRAMKDRTASPDRIESLTFAAMGALPRSRPLQEYARAEQRGTSLEGYVQRVLRSPDGDFHLSVSPQPTVRFAKLQYANAVAEITPQWRRGSRRWRFEPLTELFHSVRGATTEWQGGPRRVRLSGWLMYDYPHEGMKPQDRFHLPNVSAWEIHPVTRIEVWDDRSGAFVEVPR